MIVSELIAELQTLPSDSLVVVSKDAEGNSYSPLSDVESAWYLADSTWSGERETVTADEGGASSESVAAVYLWPTN